MGTIAYIIGTVDNIAYNIGIVAYTMGNIAYIICIIAYTMGTIVYVMGTLSNITYNIGIIAYTMGTIVYIFGTVDNIAYNIGIIGNIAYNIGTMFLSLFLLNQWLDILLAFIAPDSDIDKFRLRNSSSPSQKHHLESHRVIACANPHGC